MTFLARDLNRYQGILQQVAVYKY